MAKRDVRPFAERFWSVGEVIHVPRHMIGLDDGRAGAIVRVGPNKWIANSKSTIETWDPSNPHPVGYTVTRNRNDDTRFFCTCPARHICEHVTTVVRELLRRNGGWNSIQFRTTKDEAKRQHKTVHTFSRNGTQFYVVLDRKRRIPPTIDYLAFKYRQPIVRGHGFNKTLLEVRIGSDGKWRKAKEGSDLRNVISWAIDEGLIFKSRSHANSAAYKTVTEIWEPKPEVENGNRDLV